MKIRITTGGIFGLTLSEENPNGEYPIGHEIDLGDNEPPAGWAGRYEIVGKAPKGAEFVAGEADDDKPARRARPSS
ncbi:hypothetical protein [Sphingobium yanoikuyae]|uniref:hypothetical protein n=1 Tax=Sphingobium yanoikuyae TaxID=13690 RepID=UPI0026EABCE4|nr:hypothetical protein [Sphingobium yanoikuyae]